jgi:hypothetical protein
VALGGRGKELWVEPTRFRGSLSVGADPGFAGQLRGVLRSRTPGALHRFGPVWSLSPNKVSWTFLYSPTWSTNLYSWNNVTGGSITSITLIKLTLILSSPSLSASREFQLANKPQPIRSPEIRTRRAQRCPDSFHVRKAMTPRCPNPVPSPH